MELLLYLAAIAATIFAARRFMGRSQARDNQGSIETSLPPLSFEAKTGLSNSQQDATISRRDSEANLSQNHLIAPDKPAEDQDDDIRWLIVMAQDDPDQAIDVISRFDEELRNKAMMQFLVVLALSTKGLRPLIEERVPINLATPDDLRRHIDGQALTNLIKATEQTSKLEKAHPDYLPNLGSPDDRFGEARVDHVCTVVERLRPGLVQEIRGKTKLSYFSRDRFGFLPGLLEKIPESLLKSVLETPFTYHSTVRSAVGIYLIPSDDDPRGINFMLYRGLIGETETLGDAGDIGMLDIVAGR